MVVAVKLSNRPAAPRDGNDAPRTPTIYHAISRSVETMQGKIVTDTASAATIVIEPALTEVSGWGLHRFVEGRRFIAEGAAAAEAALPRLATALPWLR